MAIGKIAAHSAYDMFSWYKYLIVNLVFSRLGLGSGNLFLIEPFPDLCLLVPFSILNFRKNNLNVYSDNIPEPKHQAPSPWCGIVSLTFHQ